MGDIIIEGKTKQVFDLPHNPGLCFMQNKDRITAGDGVKSHALAGKAAISNQTNAKVFGILIEAGNSVFGFINNSSYIIEQNKQNCYSTAIPTRNFCKRPTGS